MNNKTTQLKKEVAKENIELFKMQQQYESLKNKWNLSGRELRRKIYIKRMRLTPKEIVLKINET